MRRRPALVGSMPAYGPEKPVKSFACLTLVALMGAAFWSGALWLASHWF